MPWESFCSSHYFTLHGIEPSLMDVLVGGYWWSEELTPIFFRLMEKRRVDNVAVDVVNS